LCLFPDDRPERQPEHGFDFAGAGLFMILLGLILFLLYRGNYLGWRVSTPIWTAVAAVLASLVLHFLSIARGRRLPRRLKESFAVTYGRALSPFAGQPPPPPQGAMLVLDNVEHPRRGFMPPGASMDIRRFQSRGMPMAERKDASSGSSKDREVQQALVVQNLAAAGFQTLR